VLCLQGTEIGGTNSEVAPRLALIGYDSASDPEANFRRNSLNYTLQMLSHPAGSVEIVSGTDVNLETVLTDPFNYVCAGAATWRLSDIRVYEVLRDAADAGFGGDFVLPEVELDMAVPTYPKLIAARPAAIATRAPDLEALLDAYLRMGADLQTPEGLEAYLTFRANNGMSTTAEYDFANRWDGLYRIPTVEEQIGPVWMGGGLYLTLENNFARTNVGTPVPDVRDWFDLSILSRVEARQ
jgi:hypothetical protein